MRTLFRRAAALLAGLLLAAALPVSAYDGYIYSSEGKWQKSVPLYQPIRRIELSAELKTPMTEAVDMCYGPDNALYVADHGTNRVLVFDDSFRFTREITGFTAADGSADSFSGPSGVFVDSENRLYVADTENNRVVVLSPEGKLVRIVGAPTGTGIPAEFLYKPVSVTADAAGRIYAVSQSSNMGVLSFDPNGEFENFIGVQKVTYSTSELFWRSLMTEAQRERSVQNIPVDFNDIEMDSEGFLFVTSAAIDKSKQYSALVGRSTTSDYAPVKRLNTSGDDILKRNGFFPPAGDLDIDTTKKIDRAVSAFAGVTVNDLGLYTVLDSTAQRLFTYDGNGSLLGVCGGIGTSIGQFMSATAVAYKGHSLTVLDDTSGVLTVMALSDIGKKIEEAIALQNDLLFDEALKKWEEILPLDRNLDSIYMDMGDAYLREGSYDLAMQFFETIGDKESYSDAFSRKRADYAGWVVLGLLVGVSAFCVLLSFVLKKLAAVNRADDLNPPERIGVKKQLCYAVYPLFHPIDGFYCIKRQKRGNTAGALIIMAAAALSYLINRYLSGYIFSADMMADTNYLRDAVQFLMPFLLFIVANYCITSLFDGEGSFHDIFVTVGYAMLPLPLLLLPTTVMCNVLSAEESMIVSLLTTVAYGWTIGLIFLGMTSIHHYGPGRNLAAMLMSGLGMLVITFLLLLFASLTQKLGMFIHNVIVELSYRL